MPDAILNARQVKDLTGLSRTTIWRLERSGCFPHRVQLSPSRVGWSREELAVWMEARKAARAAAAATHQNHVGGAGDA